MTVAMAEAAPPTLNGIDGLIVMGGPQSVYDQDRHPWMAIELALLREALRKGLPILGVCLGAQMLAAALGLPVLIVTSARLGTPNHTLLTVEALAARKDREFDARYEVEQKKKQIDENKKEKNELLSVAKSEEKAYQQVLAERQRRAEEIRSALFELRDTQGISFETALAYAIAAESVTGVRAAFILGILHRIAAVQ